VGDRTIHDGETRLGVAIMHLESSSMPTTKIRLATTADVDIIVDWLHDEYINGDGSGFWHNRNLIQDGQHRRHVTVLVDDNNKPVAFCLRNHDDLDILAVRPDRRGVGLGRELMMHVIQTARRARLLGLSGFCNPENSLPFWRAMGFEHVPHPHHALQIALPFRRRNRLLRDGPLATARIDLFADEFDRNLRKSVATPAVHSGDAWLLQNDFVEYVHDPDTLVRIAIDGTPIHSGKAKYITAIGGERECPWIRIRTISLPRRSDGG